jgi:hypothetical protein
MSTRTIVVVFSVVVAILLAVIVFQSQMQKVQPPAAQQAGEATMPPGGSGMPPGGMPPGGAQVAPPPAEANPGLAWKVPANWNTLEARSMRLATYGIPAAAGDAEGAECAVFYFGPSQGGGVQENLDRWVSQFENPKQPTRTQAEIAGFPVYRVTVTGDYLAPAGPMMQSAGTKKGYALLGAIVEGPAGRVFFKVTGPAKTVHAMTGEFDNMLKSLRKS